MKDLEMLISIVKPIKPIPLPHGYALTSLNEDNGYLYDEVMDSSFGDHPTGAYRYAMVQNYVYEVDKVFVLLNENSQPVATVSAWESDWLHWKEPSYPEVAFVGVKKSAQGKGLGALMTRHALYILQKKGYTQAHLGIRNTGDGKNYSAVKTYINCGFIPYILEDEHIKAWDEIYSYFSLPKPEYIYEVYNATYPNEEHPPIPWPYQIRRVAEAIKTGDKYLIGRWQRHNMYQIPPEWFYQLQYLIRPADNADKIINAILTNQVEDLYINHPFNPKSILLLIKDGTYLRIGKGLDSIFEAGIEAFLLERTSTI